MAGLVDSVQQSTSASDELVKIIHNPIFSDLQATLASDCTQLHVPVTLFQDRNKVESTTTSVPPATGDSEKVELVVEEATLQAEFRQLSALNNSKVSELENFYTSQSATISHQRADSLLNIQLSSADCLPAELDCVNAYYDTQQRHLVKRVTKSLQLLKCTLPMELAQPGGATKRNKSRNLDRRAVQIMSDWYDRHEDNPYPTDEEKQEMAEEGGLSLAQVKAWFANKRNRSLNTRPKRQKMKMQQQLVNICEQLTTPCVSENKRCAQNTQDMMCGGSYQNIMDELNQIVHQHGRTTTTSSLDCL